MSNVTKPLLSGFALCLLLSACGADQREVSPSPYLQFMGINLETEHIAQIDSAIRSHGNWVESRGKGWTLFNTVYLWNPAKVLLRKSYYQQGDSIYGKNSLYHLIRGGDRSDLLDLFKEIRADVKAQYPHYKFTESVFSNARDTVPDVDENPLYYYKLTDGRCVIQSNLCNQTFRADSTHVAADGDCICVMYVYSYPVCKVR